MAAARFVAFTFNRKHVFIIEVFAHQALVTTKMHGWAQFQQDSLVPAKQPIVDLNRVLAMKEQHVLLNGDVLHLVAPDRKLVLKAKLRQMRRRQQTIIRTGLLLA